MARLLPRSRSVPHPTMRAALRTIALFACFAAVPVRAQFRSDPPPSSQNRNPSSSTVSGDEEDSSYQKIMRERLERTREKERQRRIVDDANRLVELTAVYRRSLEAHGTPTAEDQKLLVQIEKLAREVKDRMRGM